MTERLGTNYYLCTKCGKPCDVCKEMARLDRALETQAKTPALTVMVFSDETLAALEKEYEKRVLVDAAIKSFEAWIRQVVRDELESQASSPTTAVPTKDSPLGVAAASTEGLTPLLQRLLGVLTEAERTHVGQCYECQEMLARLRSSLKTHVPAAPGIT